jgi:hypothetical protein
MKQCFHNEASAWQATKAAITLTELGVNPTLALNCSILLYGADPEQVGNAWFDYFIEDTRAYYEE